MSYCHSRTINISENRSRENEANALKVKSNEMLSPTIKLMRLYFRPNKAHLRLLRQFCVMVTEDFAPWNRYHLDNRSSIAFNIEYFVSEHQFLFNGSFCECCGIGWVLASDECGRQLTIHSRDSYRCAVAGYGQTHRLPFKEFSAEKEPT